MDGAIKKRRISHYNKVGNRSGANSMTNSNFGAGTTTEQNTSPEQKSTSVTYSPHVLNANCNDQNSANSDLSVNELNKHQSADVNYSGRSKSSSGTNIRSKNSNGGSHCNNNNSVNNVTCKPSAKEKLNSGVGGTSNGGSHCNNNNSVNNVTCKPSVKEKRNYGVGGSSANPINSKRRSRKSEQMQKQQNQTSPNCNSSLNDFSQEPSSNNSNINKDSSTSLAPPPSQSSTDIPNISLTCNNNKSINNV